ncbi:MAG TPA: bifunctional diaminohydroxyphosphoribosylaminopyrimidine deaminase/5-amino-6-(5-phosphoribosylamino)uracil reductase RibD [Acidimicrobiales bacterium]|jgi:diaminohydroxyphosphoribosylaminopyrimidine deaminase/5-amino-6-(5-phosphoribosylamino)uracil reductase
MVRALHESVGARRLTSPNPAVGCVIVTADGRTLSGVTEPAGCRHAEIVALDAASANGISTAGATVYVTLEPCSHHGRTPPCTDRLIDAGVAKVVVAVGDPDPMVGGSGLAVLRAAGIEVELGVEAEAAAAQLAAYLHHRRTGRPYVILKLAATLDGRTAAADGSSRWITGPEARVDVHRLRADSDAVLVGAGTVRADDPSLTVRLVEDLAERADPRRIVLGSAPPGAAVHPCTEMAGSLGEILDQLGREDVVQLLVEGGATVAGALHREGLVDRYVLYLAPALAGGDDGVPMLSGPGAPTVERLWRGEVAAVTRLGGDLRLDVVARKAD